MLVHHVFVCCQQSPEEGVEFHGATGTDGCEMKQQISSSTLDKKELLRDAVL